MTSAEFDAGGWIERLASALRRLSEKQGRWLLEYCEQQPDAQVVTGGRSRADRNFPLDDLRGLYAEVRYSKRWGSEAHYAPLRAVLDPARYALLSHPTLGRAAVAGRIVGDNDFWIRILNSGTSISAGDLIAGLMARGAELSGDRFRAAARELNAFLSPAGDGEAASVLGSLDEGCDAMLFYGLAVTERIEVADGMAMLPFGQARRFVDMDLVEKLAPAGAVFRGWRSVGAMVRPFRWRPVFRPTGDVNEPGTESPGPFFEEARLFLDLLAVSHAAPVQPLANLSDCIDRSASRLLGQESHGPGFYQSWPAQGFDGFGECPVPRPEALQEARQAFDNRESAHYERLAPFVGRLAAALARTGRFAGDARVLEIGIVLEGMYELPEGRLSRALRNRVSEFLGTDAESRARIKESVKAFHDARSNIAHSRSDKVTPFTSGAAFATGFDLARRSLFKLLREGAPGDWNKLAAAGD